MRYFRCYLAFACLAAGGLAASAHAQNHPFRAGDRIVFVGNTLAERMRHFGHFETMLTSRLKDLDLTFRNLGWSADEVTLQPRPLDFGDMFTHLDQQRATVIFLCFGFNESFQGPAGLGKFESDYQSLIDQLHAKRFGGDEPPRLVLVSPIPQERHPALPDPAERNAVLEQYTAAIRSLAARNGCTFIDLFTPLMQRSAIEPRLTINGIHLNALGDRAVAEIMLFQFGLPGSYEDAPLDPLRDLIIDKNQQFFDRWRAVNGFYIYGGRKDPFGTISFPPEMERFDEIVADLDTKIHALAKRPLTDQPSVQPVTP